MQERLNGDSRRARMTAAMICLLLSTALCDSAPAQEPDNELLWTDRPVHIDKNKQDFERLPSNIVIPTHQAGLDVPRFIKVTDSATFAFGGKTYRIRNIDPINAKRICKASDGHRWACGRMAAIFLGHLVRGRRIHCDEPETSGKLILVDCKMGVRNIGEEVIARGFGQAIGSDALKSIQDKAMATGLGIWENAACRTNFAGC